jgi:hypothetical protein
MTGIHSRHVAGDTEFAIDLAHQAVAAASRNPARTRRRRHRHQRQHRRCDGPGLWISYE